MPKVLVTDGIHESALALLKDVATVRYVPSLSADALLDEVADADALMIRSASKVTETVLQAGKQLKIIGRAGVGVDNVDLAAATQRGVVVVNSPEGNTVAASEHTVAMLMALARRIPEADRVMRSGGWGRNQLTGIEVFGKTLGVIGLGKIGKRVAKVALALGMQVAVYDPFLTHAVAEELGVTSVSLDEIWKQADFITIHAPKTRETQHLLNRNTLARCKPGVRLINCARGGIIDEAALLEALTSGQVAGVALDVFETEPLPAEDPLRSFSERVILTPHLGASTEEAQVNVALDVAAQIRDFLETGYASHAVNIPLLRKELLDPVRHYMPLAEILGQVLRQLSQGPGLSVEIISQGAVSQVDTRPLTLAVLKGLLAETREGVNYVNAPALAEEMGLSLKESSSRAAGNFLNMITVLLTTEQQTHRVSGTMIAENLFRLVDLDGYTVSIDPVGPLIFAPHQDKPGMVAKVATVLGNHGVNISALQVARREQATQGGESMMVFRLDTAANELILEELQAQEGILSIRQVCLTRS